MAHVASTMERHCCLPGNIKLMVSLPVQSPSQGWHPSRKPPPKSAASLSLVPASCSTGPPHSLLMTARGHGHSARTAKKCGDCKPGTLLHMLGAQVIHTNGGPVHVVTAQTNTRQQGAPQDEMPVSHSPPRMPLLHEQLGLACCTYASCTAPLPTLHAFLPQSESL
jgi:hypothetical protein